MKYYHVWFQTKLKKYLLAGGSLPDHMHLLIGLEGHQGLSWAIKQFKGISSRKKDLHII
jgi:REP element-mobilizing transposase RayT